MPLSSPLKLGHHSKIWSSSCGALSTCVPRSDHAFQVKDMGD